MESEPSVLKSNLIEGGNNHQNALTYEVVLGGGGIKGFGHVGLLQALEDRKVPIHYMTGISIGSIMAMLYVNGFTPDEIKEISTTNCIRCSPSRQPTHNRFGKVAIAQRPLKYLDPM